MENLPSILTPDLGLLFWMLVAFLVVLFCLTRFGFPVIIKMVDERKDYIEGEALLQEAREQQAKIMKEAAATRDAIVGQAQEKAHEEGARIISEAKKQIEIEKQSAIREIRTQVVELSVQIAEKVLSEKLSNDKAQMDLIDRLLDDVSQSENKE